MDIYHNVLNALQGTRYDEGDTVTQASPNGISELIAYQDTARVVLRIEHEYITLPPQLAKAVRAELLGG